MEGVGGNLHCPVPFEIPLSRQALIILTFAGSCSPHYVALRMR